MINVNIKQLIGNLIVVTTPETLEQDLEAKISATVLRVIQSVQVQDLENEAQKAQETLKNTMVQSVKNSTSLYENQK